MTFGQRDDAKLWIIRNQLGRRNLNGFARAELVEYAEPIIARRAREISLSNLRQSDGQKSDPRGRTDEQLAKLAGVSRDTVRKVKAIKIHGDPRMVELVRGGEISIKEKGAPENLGPEGHKMLASLPGYIVTIPGAWSSFPSETKT